MELKSPPRENSFFLRTLGGATLESVDGTPVPLAPKPLAALVLMRLLPPEECSRPVLERMLWQGVPGDSSNSLSQALVPLRDIFPDLPRGKGRFVWASRDALGCDVDLLLSGEKGGEARQAALQAYRGVFLRDFRVEQGEAEFRQWVDQRQGEYETLFRRLWEDEVAVAVHEGRWDDLERLGRHAVALDRFWQPGHAALVRALASAGDAAGARRHMQGLRRQMREDGDGEEVEGILAEAEEHIDEWAALASRSAVLHSRPTLQSGGSVASVTNTWTAGPPPPGHGRARTPRVRWGYVGGLVAALLLVGALVVQGGGGPRRHLPGGEQGAVPIAPLCVPGEARAALVEQDFKADPMNVVPPGTHFTTVWHLQNTGRCTWPATLRLHRVSTRPLSISDRDIPAQKTVAPDDTIQFPSPMVAPPDSGVFGETWVLLEADGRRVPIGDARQTLAARIRVMEGPPPPCLPTDVRAELVTRGYLDDTPLRPGQRLTYEWTVMNRASGCAWDGNYALKLVSASPTRLSLDTLVRVEEQVPPSEGYTFEMPMRAPAQEGSYTENWSLVYRDGRVVPIQGAPSIALRMMVRKDSAALPVAPVCGRGQYSIAFMKAEHYRDHSVVRAGQPFTKTWTVANRGYCTWDRGLHMHFVRATGGERSIGPTDVYLTRPVPPRLSYTFKVPMRAPSSGDRYMEYWSAIDPSGDTVRISLAQAIWADLTVRP